MVRPVTFLATDKQGKEHRKLSCNRLFKFCVLGFDKKRDRWNVVGWAVNFQNASLRISPHYPCDVVETKVIESDREEPRSLPKSWYDNGAALSADPARLCRRARAGSTFRGESNAASVSPTHSVVQSSRQAVMGRPVSHASRPS